MNCLVISTVCSQIKNIVSFPVFGGRTVYESKLRRTALLKRRKLEINKLFANLQNLLSERDLIKGWAVRGCTDFTHWYFYIAWDCNYTEESHIPARIKIKLDQTLTRIDGKSFLNNLLSCFLVTYFRKSNLGFHLLTQMYLTKKTKLVIRSSQLLPA